MSKLVGDKFGLYPKPQQFELPKKTSVNRAVNEPINEFWQECAELLRDWRAYAKDKENEADYWRRKYNKLKNYNGKSLPDRSRKNLENELGFNDFSKSKYGVSRK